MGETIFSIILGSMINVLFTAFFKNFGTVCSWIKKNILKVSSYRRSYKNSPQENR